MFLFIFAVLLVLGVHEDAWTPAHALFAIVISYGFDQIATAIPPRAVTVKWPDAIRVEYMTGGVEKKEVTQ